MAGQDINHNSTQGVPGRQYLVQLRQTLDTRFSEQELRTLCFDLGIEYEDLPGEGRASRARELLAFLDRRERIPELVGAIRAIRADISLPDLPPLEAVERPVIAVEPPASEGVGAAPARRKAPTWAFVVGAVVLLGLVGVLLTATGVLDFGTPDTSTGVPGTPTTALPTPSTATAERPPTALPTPSTVAVERPPTATRRSGGGAGVIVDNQDPGFAILAGEWLSCKSGDCTGICYGADFRWSEPSCLSCQARFDFVLPASGEYDIWAWWPRGDDRAVDTPYTIASRDGLVVVEVDQRHNGDEWRWVATLPFDAGPASVEVGGTHSGYINADAVALTPAGSGPP